MCAKKIIAVGIKKVVYVDPYPKSLAKELYEELIYDDLDLIHCRSKISFSSYYGISPKLYQYIYDNNYKEDREKNNFNKQINDEKAHFKEKNVKYVTYQTPLGYLFKEFNCKKKWCELIGEESNIRWLDKNGKKKIEEFLEYQKKFLFDDHKDSC